MKTIKVKVYKFDELNEQAQEKALQWWAEGYDGGFDWEYIQDDSKNIGLIIEQLDQHKANKGHFQISAEDTAKRIIKDHGKTCETYKDAKDFLNQYKDFGPEPEDGYCMTVQDELDSLENDFLHSLLEDYRIMMEKDYEYNSTGEGAIETIKANEYTFTKDGKRFG